MTRKLNMTEKQEAIRKYMREHGGRARIYVLAKMLGTSQTGIASALSGMYDVAEEDNGELLLV